MKRIIGLDRELKLHWLDLAANFAQAERDKLALRARLMESLASDIPAHFVRVKTCTVLIRTWLKVPSEQEPLRDRAFDLIRTVAPEHRIVIHWGMLLLAYPFFREVTAAIGKSISSDGMVSRMQVSRKLAQTWGERTTVKRAVNRVFQTLETWQLLCAIEGSKGDAFHAAKAKTIDDVPLALWLAEASIRAGDKAIPFSALRSLPENFPFHISLALNAISRTGRFETFREAREMLVGLAYSEN